MTFTPFFFFYSFLATERSLNGLMALDISNVGSHSDYSKKNCQQNSCVKIIKLSNSLLKIIQI